MTSHSTETIMLQIDPNVSTTDAVRGYATGTLFRTYLIGNGVSTIEIRVKSKMTQGALKAKQYQFRVPDEECEGALDCSSTSEEGEEGSESKTYSLSPVALKPAAAANRYAANPSDVGSGTTCTILVGDNPGGELIIKPWIAHRSLIMGAAQVLEGKGTICPDTASEDEEEKTWKFDLEQPHDYEYRLTIGLTFALNSFNKGTVIDGIVNNLDAYVFTPSIEDVTVTILVT